jgi:hypothetical protein
VWSEYPDLLNLDPDVFDEYMASIPGREVGQFDQGVCMDCGAGSDLQLEGVDGEPYCARCAALLFAIEAKAALELQLLEEDRSLEEKIEALAQAVASIEGADLVDEIEAFLREHAEEEGEG